MPTNRRRLRRPRVDDRVPAWAERLKMAGEVPERESEDWDAWIAWLYFNEPTPGLPDANSEAGRKLWAGRLL